MHTLTPSTTTRRSSRVPAIVPILVTSLEPGAHFSEVCETLVVSAHGCALRSPIKLQAGVPLHLHSKNGRQATAKVVSCLPGAAEGQGWQLGAKLDRPENFWELTTCPTDWVTLSGVSASRTLPATNQARNEEPDQLDRASEILADNLEWQGPANDLQKMIAESVRPLQAEIVALKEKLARSDKNRSRFEVSLSSIPPELESQLEARLKQDLGPRMVEEVRQQAATLLAAAKVNIEQMTTEGYRDFLQRVAEELQVVEHKAEDISKNISEALHEKLQRCTGELQQNLVDAGNRLKRLSEELLEFSQNSLREDHEIRHAELEQVREAVASESARLQEQVESLDSRIIALNESTSRLESGLDKRLEDIASEIVRATSRELRIVADISLKEVTTRNGEMLGEQLNEARRSMTSIQSEIASSLSQTFSTQAEAVVQDVHRSMEEAAKLSVQRWRLTLANGLNSLVSRLGDDFQVETDLGTEPTT